MMKGVIGADTTVVKGSGRLKVDFQISIFPWIYQYSPTTEKARESPSEEREREIKAV